MTPLRKGLFGLFGSGGSGGGGWVDWVLVFVLSKFSFCLNNFNPSLFFCPPPKKIIEDIFMPLSLHL